MAEERYFIAENDRSLFAVSSEFVYKIAEEEQLFPLPFSKSCVGGFFLSKEFLIPLFFFTQEGFGEYSGSLMILNWQANFISLPIKRALEFADNVSKVAEILEDSPIFTEQVYYKDLFEIPVLDIKKLYKLAGFN